MYEHMKEMNDVFTADMMELQEMDEHSSYYGGIIDPVSGVARPNHGSTARVIASWAASLANPDSIYYRHAELIDRLKKATSYMVKSQHEDGTISLGSTNYHSPPDTGFVVVGLAQVYRLLKKAKWTELDPVVMNLHTFLERTIPALVTGGCHTPNHRWVLTAALSSLYELFQKEELVDRAQQWLDEGLDYTDDGEWTERSNGIYNAVTNVMLYHTARILKRPELLIPVRKNLEMMQYLIHPNGDVVTDYSGRQDFGERATLAGYFVICKWMALHDQNALFSAMADAAAASSIEPQSGDNHAMLAYLLYPEMREEHGLHAELPKDYLKVINRDHPRTELLQWMAKAGHGGKVLHSAVHSNFGSPVVRYRKERQSVTMMTNTPSFFALREGEAYLLGVKVSSAFSPGVVLFEEMKEENGAFVFKARMEKGYNGPLAPEKRTFLPPLKEGGTPWYALPHQERPVTHLQTHQITATVKQAADGWTIRLWSDSLEDVFTQVTFIFAGSGLIESEGQLVQTEDGHFLLAEGNVSYSSGADTIKIGPGANEHRLPVLRDDSHPSGCSNVSINMMSPFDVTFTIQTKSNQGSQKKELQLEQKEG